MYEERQTDKLARYLLWAAGAALVLALCWRFRNVIIYITMAAVVSLLARPLVKGMQRVRIKGRSAPKWLLALIALFLIIGIFAWTFVQIVPVVMNIVQNISGNLQSASSNSAWTMDFFERCNIWLIDRFPSLGRDFKVQVEAVDWFRGIFDISSVTTVIGSVATAVGSTGVAIFSIVFIAFFFVKDENLFKKIIAAIVPDKAEEKAIKAIGDIEVLLSRYFVGLVSEILAVAILNFLGLWLIARIGFSPAIGIAFITGLLNVIPYVGPWIGAGIGTVLGIVLRFSSAAALGASPDLLVVALTLVAIFCATQFIDNTLLQPLIYSTSIKSSPLEIFIVLLVSGSLGGMLGMLVAIPSYTIVRVIAARFFGDFKPIRRLVGATGPDGPTSPEE